MEAMGTVQLRPLNTLTNPALMRYTHVHLTTVVRYVPINSDINLQDLSHLTFMVDS